MLLSPGHDISLLLFVLLLLSILLVSIAFILDWQQRKIEKEVLMLIFTLITILTTE
jgi:hypothetical protein